MIAGGTATSFPLYSSRLARSFAPFFVSTSVQRPLASLIANKKITQDNKTFYSNWNSFVFQLKVFFLLQLKKKKIHWIRSPVTVTFYEH